MSTRLHFSKGWFMLIALFHAAGSIYFCAAASLSPLRNHLAWYWNPLAKFCYSSEVTILASGVIGLPVSGLVGVGLGYLMPLVFRNRVKSRGGRFAIVSAAFIVMLLIGPAGFHLLFPFLHTGDLGIFIFGPIYLGVVWVAFTMILAMWVVDFPASVGWALLLTIAWLAVAWIYSAATYVPSSNNPHTGP